MDEQGEKRSPKNHNKKEMVSSESWWDEPAPIYQKISPENTSLVTEMESISETQETVDEVRLNQPPKRKRKKEKLSFQAWLELHTPIDKNVSAENTEKQDASLVPAKESISKTQEINQRRHNQFNLSLSREPQKKGFLQQPLA